MTRRGEFYSTESLLPSDRAAGWTTVISDTYFPLHLRFRDPDRFRGRLSRRPIGAVSLSRLRTAPAEYERRRPDIPAGAEGHPAAEKPGALYPDGARDHLRPRRLPAGTRGRALPLFP
ncbi:MAG TPA: hypothetical protein PLL33_03595 [Paracoccus sp. (in: a-proteobacteria)]|nr:hypothetical protein [Paracoccus sp. (in: a-proteobacteria)]